MTSLRSWTALLNREYIEHRMAFLYFPLGILALLGLAAASALLFNHSRPPFVITTPLVLKGFELGYLGVAALWLAYLAIALFFFFGDAFSADKRNNAMFFWKSMPVSDLKILVTKTLAGILVFPAILFVMTLLSGLMTFVFVNLAAFVLPDVVLPNPATVLASFAGISGFVLVYTVLALLWYLPVFAWVGALAAVVGRWSLALAFLIPGLLAVVENIVFFGHGPGGGYVLSYLGGRSVFGLVEADYRTLALPLKPFDMVDLINRLLSHIDWMGMGIGIAFAAVAIWAASEYRRRRIA